MPMMLARMQINGLVLLFLAASCSSHMNPHQCDTIDPAVEEFGVVSLLQEYMSVAFTGSDVRYTPLMQTGSKEQHTSSGAMDGAKLLSELGNASNPTTWQVLEDSKQVPIEERVSGTIFADVAKAAKLEPVYLRELSASAAFTPAPKPGSGAKPFSWDWEAFGQAIGILGLSELFDQSWFLTMVLAIKFGWMPAFIGGVIALSIHTTLCGFIGYEISQHLRVSTIQFLAACLFFTFSILWARAAYYADTAGNFLSRSIEEAEEEFTKDTATMVTHADGPSTPAEGLLTGTSPKTYSSSMLGDASRCCFFQFIGEMGDRSQIALVELYGSQPLLPVAVGSEITFFVLVLSATLCGELIEGARIDQRLLLSFVCCTFVVFALFALQDAVSLRSQVL